MPYKKIIEETEIEVVNQKIQPNGGFDFIETKKKRINLAEGQFAEKITYILGQKYQEEDSFSQ